MTQQHLTDLDQFLIRNNQQPTPKRSNSLYHPKNQQQNLLSRNPHCKQNQPLIGNHSRSPARCSSNNTLNSQENTQSSLGLSRQRAKSRKSSKIIKRHCENHENLQGSYHINIENEDLFYCQKCANKLRSQGFPIKLENRPRNRNTQSRIQTSQGNSMLSSFPHLDGHPQFQILKMLLSTIYSAEEEVKAKNSKYESLDKIYEHACENFEETMDTIEQIVRMHRSKGRKLLKKHLHDYQKQNNSDRIIENSLSQIQVMKGDIEENIESIVGQIDTTTFEQCVQNYQLKLQELSMTTKEHTSSIERAKSEFENDSQQIFSSMRREIDTSIDFASLDNSESILCTEGLPQSKPSQKRGPFRTLFPTETNARGRRGLSTNE